MADDRHLDQAAPDAAQTAGTGGVIGLRVVTRNGTAFLPVEVAEGVKRVNEFSARWQADQRFRDEQLIAAADRAATLPAEYSALRRDLVRAANAARRRRCARIVPPRVRPRRRGAGRPRAQATRSCARSGDSGDDGPGPSLALAAPPRALLTYALLSAERRGELGAVPIGGAA